jgi:hypothetical protein
MRRSATRVCFASFIGCVLAISLSISAGASRSGLSALIGKRIAGAPASWQPIQRLLVPSIPKFGLPRTVTYVIATGQSDPSFSSVQFYKFSSLAAAKNYYEHPATNLADNPAFLRPLKGADPAPSPSRWVDLEQCIYEHGPNPHRAPIGAPASVMTGSGNCSIGTPTSTGLGSITRRGSVVMVVNSPEANQVFPIPNSISSFSLYAALNVASLTVNGSKLLRSVGIN